MNRQEQQLQLLRKIEQDKADRLAGELHKAQQFLEQSQRRLDDVRAYKLDYLTQMQGRAQAGVLGGNFQHFQRFIVQLDQGISKQGEVIRTAQEVVNQRRALWLEQRQKVSAVELLIEKKAIKKQQAESKEEQKLADEFGAQKFIRQQLQVRQAGR